MGRKNSIVQQKKTIKNKLAVPASFEQTGKVLNSKVALWTFSKNSYIKFIQLNTKNKWEK